MTNTIMAEDFPLLYHLLDFNISKDEIKAMMAETSGRQPDDNMTDPPVEDILQKNDSIRILIITIYAIAIFIGFIENMLVFIVIVRHRHLHKVTNIFIAALALSDIMLCVFNLPFQLHYQLTNKWAFGEVLCRIIMSTFGVPIFVSTACMMMIALDRYFLIVCPFKTRITKKKSLIIISVIVFLTFILAMPVMIYTKYDVVKVPEVNLHQVFCIEVWTRKSATAYSFSIFCIQFLFPLIVVTFLYFEIYRVLKRRPLKRTESRRNNRTNKILIAIVLLFTVSWLPFNLFSLIVLLNHKIVYGPYFKLTDMLLKIVAMSSACINPFMYGWLNDNFRREFGIMLGKKVKQFKMRQNGYSNTYAAEPSKSGVDRMTTAL